PPPPPPSVALPAPPVAPPVVEPVTTRPALAPLSARVAPPEPAVPRYETPSPSTTGASEAPSDIDGEFSAFEAEGATELDAGKALRERATALGELGRAIGKAEPTRALAYRLVRAAAWLPLENLPGRGGKLGTSSSPSDVREAVRRAIDEGDWAELLRRAEDELLLTPLWLDLQRYVAVALEQLGPAYRTARDEVGAASAALAYRHPEVLSYSFDDDAPVADDETRAWFEAEAKRWAKGGWLFAEDVAIDRRSREARELAAAGRLEEGLGLAAEIARRGADPRARFLGRLELARLAMAQGAHDLARPVIEALVLLVERHNLDEWEPTLAASAYEELVRCLRTELGRAGVDDAPAREASVFEKLCRLDPAAALRAVKPT
nr:type VI secretion system domain-containing protein [Polyangiaceae bacterium]